MIKGLKHQSYKEKLRELEMEKKKKEPKRRLRKIASMCTNSRGESEKKIKTVSLMVSNEQKKITLT